MKRHTQINPKKGMSLADVLVGIFIFGVVFTAGIAGLKYSSALTSSQNEVATADSVLNEISEDIWAQDYSALSVGSSLGTFFGPGGAGEPEYLNDLTNASVSVAVSEVEAGLKKVKIILNWDATVGTSSPQVITIYRQDPDA